MAWEIKNKDRGVFLVAPTELQVWILFLGYQGKCFSGSGFLEQIRLFQYFGFDAVEIPL